MLRRIKTWFGAYLLVIANEENMMIYYTNMGSAELKIYYLLCGL